MPIPCVPTLRSLLTVVGVGVLLCVPLAASDGVEGEEQVHLLTLRERPPPVRGLDDFTVLDDRLWTAAVSRRPERISTAPAAVEVLTGDDLRLSAAANWADRLRYVAGVDVYQSRHSQYDVGLRGYNGVTNQRLIILVDGREFGRSVTGEQYGFWSGFMFLSDIERLELVKGPSSVTYGANAFGGVISLSGRPVGDQPAFYTHSHVGSYGKREVDGTVLAPMVSGPQWLRRLDLKVNAGYTEAEARPSVMGDPVQMSHPRLGDTGDNDLRSNRQRVILGYALPAELRLEVEYSGLHMREQALTSLYTAVTSAGHFEQHGFGLTLRADWGTFRYWDQNTRATWTSEYIAYDPSRDFYYNQAGFRDRRRIADADIFLTHGDHRLTFGGNVIHWESRSNAWTRDSAFLDRDLWKRVTNRSSGVFAQDQWSVVDDWTITGGIRYDHNSRVGGNWSPRLAVNWEIDPSQFVRLSYSQGYRIPNLIESDLQLYFYDSDPDLEAESIQAVEVGYERRLLDGDGRLVANVSYSRANNLISFQPLPAAEMEANWNDWLFNHYLMGNASRTPGPFFLYGNEDNPLTVIGAELSLAHTWRDLLAGGDVEWWGNGTYQYFRYSRETRLQSDGFVDPSTGDVIFRFDGILPRDVNGPPPWKANMGVNWDNGHLQLGVAGRWVSSRTMFSVGNTFWRTRDELAIQRIDSYAAMDLHAAWRREGGYGTLWLRAGVMDIFDSAHYEAYRRSPEDLQEDLAKTWSSEVGRSWFAAVDWHW